MRRHAPSSAAAIGRTSIIAAAVICITAFAGAGRVAASASTASATVAKPAPIATPHVSPATVIRHVVVFYQENHSFDETLGKFCELHGGRCDGYVGPVRLHDGTVVNMTPSTDGIANVWHDVHNQDLAIDNGAMDGWNRVIGCRARDGYMCLRYYSPSQIPSLTTLADKFAVSDRTFSMADSPSWGGHVYAAAATQDNFTGDIPVPEAGVAAGPAWGCDSKKLSEWIDPMTHQMSMQPSCIPAQPGTLDPKTYPNNGAFRATPVSYVPTIFDRLDAKHLSWKLYSDIGSVWSICPSFAECQFGPQHMNVVPPTDFIPDVTFNNLPSYSVLLPGGPAGTSQHNGASMLQGDNWIGKTMTALEHSPEWSSTAVFITYDDCGCFYDHVAPGVNPDGTRQGIRVPMVIVSPYAKAGYTDSQPATFASILKFAEETFGLAPLSVNDAGAYDYANSFDFTVPPSGPRAVLSQHPVSAAAKRFAAAHPWNPNDDPT